MELRPYQQLAREAIWHEWDTEGRRKTLLVLPTGCHRVGEKLLRSDGTSICVEDIQVGDNLMGADGTPRAVLHTQQGTGCIYMITPVKGEPFYVTGNHKLTLVQTNTSSNPRYPSDCNGGKIIDVTVDKWLTWSKQKKHIYKLVRSNCIEKFDLPDCNYPLDPYYLGLLLGDEGLKTTVNVATPDCEVATELKRQAAEYKMYLDEVPAGGATTCIFNTTCIFKGDGTGCKRSVLHRQLSKLGLRHCGSASTFVPQIYKTAPACVRKEILAGLLDSDGSVSVKPYDFISKSEKLSEDVMFISRSLGLAAYLTKCTKGIKGGFSGTYYRVSISGNCSIIPCRVSRKKIGARIQKKDVLRTGFSVQAIGDDKYVGITVNKDNRYLLSDFTITHNCGKTIVFSKVIEDEVSRGGRVLVLAHRGELLEQAADKLAQSTHLGCAVEKAEQTSSGSWYRVVVGSVQTMMREKRLKAFAEEHFTMIIVDEAHHILSESYQAVLEHFPNARVLGVTATADRGDKRNLGIYFDSLAYEYTLPAAIRDGYLCRIEAQTIPLELDLVAVSLAKGDFKASDLDSALDPYLEKIADEMVNAGCLARKTLVFLPLVKTSQKFAEILRHRRFACAEVNGKSKDRSDILPAFALGNLNVLCNSMLLTEGWDCPSVDCIVVLRPTKIRSLYCQMVGRGTRPHPGKESLLLLDFLWHTDRHELCHPAQLITDSPEVAKKMTEKLADAACPQGLDDLLDEASSDVVRDREESLAKVLEEQRKKKRKLVDPLQFEMSIQAQDLLEYTPEFAWEMLPPTIKQIEMLEKRGIFAETIESQGYANMLIDKLNKRQSDGLSTPRQIRLLEQRGFEHVGSWSFESASALISRIAANGWKVPYDINPKAYAPKPKEQQGFEPWLP